MKYITINVNCASMLYKPTNVPHISLVVLCTYLFVAIKLVFSKKPCLTAIVFR